MNLWWIYWTFWGRGLVGLDWKIPEKGWRIAMTCQGAELWDMTHWLDMTPIRHLSCSIRSLTIMSCTGIYIFPSLLHWWRLVGGKPILPLMEVQHQLLYMYVYKCYIFTQVKPQPKSGIIVCQLVRWISFNRSRKPWLWKKLSFQRDFSSLKIWLHLPSSTKNHRWNHHWWSEQRTETIATHEMRGVIPPSW